MNALVRLNEIDVWQLAGWTMLHYLWLGMLAGLAAGALRLMLRRAPAHARYVAALACFTVLALLPLGVAVWIGANPQAADQPVKIDTAVVNVPSTASRPDDGGTTIDLATTPAADAPPIPVNHRVAATGSASAHPEPQAASAKPNAVLPLAVFALESSTHYLPWLWLVGTPLTFLLLATGIFGSERLRRASRILQDGPIADARARLVASLRIGRRVTVAVCERIAAPVLVGIVRPIILLPPAALTGWSPEEIEMVLLHELAHVRRWDNLVNLLQRCIESLLFFQPAVWLVSNWIRREREACCDAAVVGRTNRPHAYAELLVALAAQMPRSVLFHPAASSAMAASPLRGRIRRILQLEDDPMLISGKSLAVVMSGLLLAATLVVLNLPARGQAKESEPDVVESKPTAVTHVYGIGTNPPIELNEEEGQRIVAEVLKNPQVLAASIMRLPEGRQMLSVRLNEIAGKRAFVAWDKNAEGKLTCRIEFIDVPADSPPGPRPAPQPVVDGAQSLGDQKFAEVPFVQGATQFLDGDKITIREIRGTARNFEPGNVYRIKGTYTLGSHELAQLAVYVTAEGMTNGTGLTWKTQWKNVDRGNGTFEFLLPMPYRGWPHVSFYPADGGEGFGGVYFGTGDTVLKKWWGKKASDNLQMSNQKDLTKEATAGTGVDSKITADRVELDSRTGRVTFDAQNGRVRLRTKPKGEVSTSAKTVPASGRPTEVAEKNTVDQGRDDLSEDEWVKLLFVASDENPMQTRSYLVPPSLRRSLPDAFEGLKEDPYGLQIDLKPKWNSDRSAVEITAPKNAHVAMRAWQELGIKVVPATTAERTAPGGRAIKVVGGVPAPPPGTKGPIFLQSVGNRTVSSFDELASMLEQVKGNESTVVECIVTTDSGPSRIRLDAGSPIKANASLELQPLERTIDTKLANFPSLEDQKLADLAWDRLGLELEAIDGDDLKRVQALGYEGGLRIASSRKPVLRSNDFIPPNFIKGDLLVGLHVWPTTSLTDIAKVLNRDDLAELNPLKFYVVRAVSDSAARYGSSPYRRGDGGKTELKDTVVTGRISVKLPTRRTSQSATTKPRPAVAENASPSGANSGPHPTSDKSNLRYDGKTFDQWRTMWQTELSTEKRLEAVKALAAFGANGYGKDAAEAILDVASQYDFTEYGGESSEGQLENAIVEALARKIPMKDWLPEFRNRYESGRLKRSLFVYYLLSQAHTNDRDIRDEWRELLLQVATDPAYKGRIGVLEALVRTDRDLKNTAIRDLIRQNLRGDERQVMVAIQSLAYANVCPPELTDVLLHGDELKKQSARNAFDRFSGSNLSTAILNIMVDVLRDPKRADDHLAAIRALAAVGPAAQDSERPAILEKILKAGDQAQQVAAAVALERISHGSTNADNVLQAQLTDEKGKPRQDIQTLIQAERQATFGRRY